MALEADSIYSQYKRGEQIISTAIIYYSKHQGNTKKLLDAIATAGNPTKNCFNSIAEIANEKHCNELGRYICHGFDTFGPFKLVGGLQKGHPTDEEIQGADYAD